MIDYLIRTMPSSSSGGSVTAGDVEARVTGDDLLSAEAERFERRLTDEISSLRVEMHESIAALRVEMHDGLAVVRQEFRQELATIRHDMANLKADLLKWSFLFWIGQVATIAALLSFMLRSAGR